MDIFDRLALWGRRYDRQRNPRTGGDQFNLRDLLEYFRLKTILELTPVVNGTAAATHKPDPVRKLKISILDEGIPALGDSSPSYYELFATGSSGDYTRMRVVARNFSGASVGELKLLIAERMPELYFSEDPIFAAVDEHAKTW